MTPAWIEQLLHNPALRDDFIEYIDNKCKLFTQTMEKAILARDINAAEAALSKRNAIRSILREIEAYEREDKANVAYNEETKGGTDG